MDLDKFFNMFLFNNKKALFFSIKQFELKSGGDLEITEELDLAAIVK